MSKAPAVPAQPDLPAELVALGVPVELRGLNLEACVLERIDLSDREASEMRLVESRLVQVDLGGSALKDASFRDVVALDGSWANVRAEGARLRRVQLQKLRLTGANFSDAAIEDATFVDCRIDLASFRFAKLERVSFERCRMEEVDFYAAKLASVVFADCILAGATWGGATFIRSEMRGCDLSGAGNPEALRGVRMPWPDIINAAGELAAAVGIEIIE
ncbi:MAG TPA: pentapeptide repeat-containing protein [Gaiellaceae bacterium]|nr:pentapeptide repeat-containing protein [Gaiellaceae bacterium]HYT51578.1 pentapeptide repeat-containing protein [Gaiellaceae bacterium]